MIPRTSAFAWAATFLGLSGPFTEPMYFCARSSRVFALRGRRVIARISDRFMVFKYLQWQILLLPLRKPEDEQTKNH
jgi:hypothetical protein